MVSATFLLVRMAPGGPFSAERQLPPEVERALRERFHLDQPLHVQYVKTLAGLLRGDFGPSMKNRERDVADILRQHLPPSLLLGSLAIALALAAGVAAGSISALRPGSAGDYLAMGAAVLGISLPAFVIGPLLQLLFAMRLGWLPVAGYGSPAQLVLPAMTLALPFAARFARLSRAGLLEVLGEDYIRTARAKGLSERMVLMRHALPGALLPVISYLGPAVAAVTTGSLVVERVFSIPGLGREFVESALNRDYTLVMGTTIVYGLFIIACNTLTDLAQLAMDPRLREGRA
jgi:oligopeptide transport system permease protein